MPAKTVTRKRGRPRKVKPLKQLTFEEATKGSLRLPTKEGLPPKKRRKRKIKTKPPPSGNLPAKLVKSNTDKCDTVTSELV